MDNVYLVKLIFITAANNVSQTLLVMFAKLDILKQITVLVVIQDITFPLIPHLLALYVLLMLISIVNNAQAHRNARSARLDGQAIHVLNVIQAIAVQELAQLAFLAIILRPHTVDHAHLFMINASPAQFQQPVLLVRLVMMLPKIAEFAQQVTIQILTQEL